MRAENEGCLAEGSPLGQSRATRATIHNHGRRAGKIADRIRSLCHLFELEPTGAPCGTILPFLTNAPGACVLLDMLEQAGARVVDGEGMPA